MQWMTPADMARELGIPDRKVFDRIVAGRLRCEGRNGRVMVCARSGGVAPAGLGRLGRLLVVALLLVAGTGGLIGYRMLSDLRERAEAAEDRGAQLSAQLTDVQAELRAARAEAADRVSALRTRLDAASVRAEAAENGARVALRRLGDVEAALAAARRETSTQLATTRDDLAAARRELGRTGADLRTALLQLAEMRRQATRAETRQARQAEQLTAVQTKLKTVGEDAASARAAATARIAALSTTTSRLGRQVAEIQDEGRKASAAIRSLSEQLATLAVRVVKACASQPGPTAAEPVREPENAPTPPPPVDLAAGSQPSAEHYSPSLLPPGRTVMIHGHSLAQDGAGIDTSATAIPCH